MLKFCFCKGTKDNTGARTKLLRTAISLRTATGKMTTEIQLWFNILKEATSMIIQKRRFLHFVRKNRIIASYTFSAFCPVSSVPGCTKMQVHPDVRGELAPKIGGSFLHISTESF